MNSLAFNLTTVDVTEDMGPFEIAVGTQWDDGPDFEHGMFPPKSHHPRYQARAQRKMPKMGDISARSALTIHRGTANQSDKSREQHVNVHPFPSSVDVPHFAQARLGPADPADQAHLPRPRIGFCGVIDERMDLALVEGVARAGPDWQLVMVGPGVKISPDSLPRLPNIHYLGGKGYKELPAYLANWDVAMTPFARTPATRFLSPTKTPEYLAVGRPVVSTFIRDVVRPYGEQGLVRIADTPEAFVRAVEESLSQSTEAWLPRVDAFLSRLSWDHTWSGMKHRIDEAVRARAGTGVSELVE